MKTFKIAGTVLLVCIVVLAAFPFSLIAMFGDTWGDDGPVGSSGGSDYCM